MDILQIVSIIFIFLVISFIIWYMRDSNPNTIMMTNSIKVLIGTEDDENQVRAIRLLSGVNIYPDKEIKWKPYDNYHILIDNILVPISDVLDTKYQEFSNEIDSVTITSDEFKKILEIVASKQEALHL